MSQRFAVGFWKILVVAALVWALVTASAGAAPATVSASGPEGAAPGDQVTVSFSLTNTGDNTSGYILDISVPDGWTIVDRTDDGGIWNSDDKKWLWQSVDPEGTVSPSVTLQVPDDASGDATVTATGKDASGVVDSDSISISIQSDTPTDTPTDEPDDEPTDTPTDTPTETPTGTPTDTSEQRSPVPATDTQTDTSEATSTEPSMDTSGDAATDTSGSTVSQPAFGNDVIIVGGLAVYAAGVLIRRRA